MSWHYLREGEAASWEGASLDGAPSALLSLLPTLEACCSPASETATLSLAKMATLCARDYKHPGRSRLERTGSTAGECLPQVGGPLNPTWCEWFMGWPVGWTESRPLETARFQQWLHSHGACCQRG